MKLTHSRDDMLLIVQTLVAGHEKTRQQKRQEDYDTDREAGAESPSQKRARLARTMILMAEELTAKMPAEGASITRNWPPEELETMNAAITACIGELAFGFNNAPKTPAGQAIRDEIDWRLEPLRALRANFRPNVYEKPRNKNPTRLERPGEETYRQRVAKLIAQQLHGEGVVTLDNMMATAWEAIDATTFDLEGAHSARMPPEEAANAILRRDLRGVVKQTVSDKGR